MLLMALVQGPHWEQWGASRPGNYSQLCIPPGDLIIFVAFVISFNSYTNVYVLYCLHLWQYIQYAFNKNFLKNSENADLGIKWFERKRQVTKKTDMTSIKIKYRSFLKYWLETFKFSWLWFSVDELYWR